MRQVTEATPHTVIVWLELDGVGHLECCTAAMRYGTNKVSGGGNDCGVHLSSLLLSSGSSR